MLTIEICCQVLHHPVYFCDGATAPLLGYDVVSAASLVIDTEARQAWFKRTLQYGHAEQFTPPATEPSIITNPATVRRSSTTAHYRQLNGHQPVNRLQRLHYYTNHRLLNRHQLVVCPSSVNYYTDYRRPAHCYSIRRRSANRCPISCHRLNYPRHLYYAVGDRLPSCESSRPSHYRLAASSSSPTSTDLGDCTYDSDRSSSLQPAAS